MTTIEQVILQDLTNQIANLTADRAVWRARALMAERELEENASDDEDLEVKDE